MVAVRLPRWAADAATFLIAPVVARYLQSQQTALANRAVPLSAATQQRLLSYFDSSVLRQARLVEADPLPIAPLPLTGLLGCIDRHLPAVALTEGITFGNLIAVRRVPNDRLLFHELVHVVQYRMLGVRRFAYLYVRGLLMGGCYEEIPLERCAFVLERRFAREQESFRVEDEVAAWLAADRG